MRAVMATFAAVCAIAALWPATAAERKPIAEVSVDALIRETQSTVSTPRRLDLAWFVPVEFWQAATSGRSADPVERETLIAAINSYFMIITVQADITPLGSFDFFEMKPQSLYLADPSTTAKLEPLSELPPQMAAVIGVLKPIMSQSLGPMGQNLNYYVYADQDDGARRVSPYEKGAIEVAMIGRDGEARSQHRIELPLDALHVPRLCANGKPAHISWVHCPCDGEKLAE